MPAREWILSSYADVSAALREPGLCASASTDHTAHDAMRAAAARELSPERLAAYRAESEPLAYNLAYALPVDQPVDLMDAFARPWSFALAIMATGAPAAGAPRLDTLAREIFLGAAFSTDSLDATAELARSFPGLGALLAVQSFVALSQTLPCFLANAWLELIRHPGEAGRLRAEPALMPQAVEELLRYAGPSRALFRRAMTQVSIGEAEINEGDRVILMVSAANRDPARFREPDRLDFHRNLGGHLGFGAGTHSCSGAPLIRMAAAIATRALLATTNAIELAAEPDWVEGFAIRVPASLIVYLSR